MHNNYQSESTVGECCRHFPSKIYRKPHSRSLQVKEFVKMTENNYVSKEDPGKQETLCQSWADVEPASQTLGQHQPSIGVMARVCRDGVVSSGHSFGRGPPTKTGHWACVGSMLAHLQRRWPSIERTPGQCHVFAGGCSWRQSQCYYTADEGVTDLIVCIHLRLALPLPKKTWYSSHLLCKGSICSLVKWADTVGRL